MNKKELIEKFEKNVEYLKKNVPPDDIYPFAEQTFMSALFFLNKWSQTANITEEMLRCPATNKWINNILGFQRCKDENIDIDLDLQLDEEDET